jgi:hypothetical protein
MAHARARSGARSSAPTSSTGSVHEWAAPGMPAGPPLSSGLAVEDERRLYQLMAEV